ncbi:hypothetical protein B0T13DRAFT_486319 [Neurospora crassa]|nr:hypothetical protein B0T13DRAFT_486319 [Neurospora crassa]
MALKNQRCCRVPQYQVTTAPACPLGVYLQGVEVPLPPAGHLPYLYVVHYYSSGSKAQGRPSPSKQLYIIVHLRTGQADLQWAVTPKCKPPVLILSQTTNPSRIIYRRRRRRPHQAITKLGIAIEHHRHHIDINIRTTTTPPPPPPPPPPPTTTTVTP